MKHILPNDVIISFLYNEIDLIIECLENYTFRNPKDPIEAKYQNKFKDSLIRKLYDCL